ncbi:MAG: RecQ family ATP-dependent DNA helicase [Planctomycetes bacterium]|nr:RecQ family ATP-dependent DNA helicase [Planctomycetota bacterium]
MTTEQANYRIDDALSQFGLSSFRPGQREVIEQVVAGEDCLCVMPTGGGKSLCYQLPSVVRPGLTIVVSPLIALMKDQVDGLNQRGIPATLINSSLSHTEQQYRLQDVAAGKYRLLYVAPERLRNQRFIESIRATPIQLLAIDEAHCISQWGHDFRPDYQRLGKFRQWLGDIQTIALTATATQRVRDDIVQTLGLRRPKEFINGFARTNLHFGVVHCQSERDKQQELKRFLETRPGSGIIYAATRKRCEELVEFCNTELKMSIGGYHAGLLPEQRRAIQDRFMDGQLEIIVATNAFGMGIDKPDLRFVVHYNMPGTLEAYYQEAGRAGRDGLFSQCVLLYGYQDRFVQEFFIENAHPGKDIVRRVYEYVMAQDVDPIEQTQQEIRDALQLSISAEAVGTSLQILSRTGVLERLEAGQGLAMLRINSDLPSLIDVLPREAKNQRKAMRAIEKAVGDRRYEQVFVHPRWLEQQADMDHDSLLRALREVTKLESVEYVPPFRGRAVHVRKRGIPFEELKIDFHQLQQRKNAEIEKLEQVIAFAQARVCRQMSIIEYFGDPNARPCGLCDRCQGKVGWPKVNSNGPASSSAKSASTSAASAKNESTSQPPPAIMQKVLEAIARTHGRLGKNLLAQFLQGSQNAKVQRLRLERLAGFGLLEVLSQAQAVQVLDALLQVGILAQQEVTAHRPTVLVTPVGEAVLKGKDPWPELTLSKTLRGKLEALQPSPSPTPSPSQVATKKPVAATAPETPQSKPTKVADDFTLQTTKVVPQAPGSTPAVAQSKPVEPSAGAMKPSSDGVAKPDWYWTWRLLSDGYSWEHCLLIRRIDESTALADLRSSKGAGRPLPKALPQDVQAKLS